MIMNILFALFLALAIAGYWILCRYRAYQYQKKAVKLMNEYFDDGQVSDKDKRSLYQSYVILRKWYIFPVFALLTPFIIIFRLILRGGIDLQPTKRTNHELYEQAYDQLMKMAISKNPIIATISMASAGISLAILIPISLLMMRLKSVPRTDDYYALVVEKLTLKAAERAHIH
ncbi:hypothetical protein RCM87_21945 [Escherichia marmotae]|uniref:hypothetical protein n=1 Tax=Escherichia marmotae TaxID=1499973 RepID=UPI001650CA72|nr:hypothetical protein [Escherichia coli]MEC9695224.1 hypothetical protein [Escherichia marmotae]MEC9802605.1 hypothetical protein [Escherichia marmotae]MEC9821617.1 hypothetical protein [Escherichia marmotae]MEC9972294.1 hypothetical protein [Escherichia marmotae]